MATGVSKFPLVLASASPRRLQLLKQLGIEPNAVDPAGIDETPLPRELPVGYARRMALAKVKAAAARHPQAFVLAADTVVAMGRRILPKAGERTMAEGCLRQLSGRRHRVIGGVALALPDGKILQRVVQTSVNLKRLTDAEIDAYLDSGEWQDKAGGYAVQGRAAAFVSQIGGSYSNIVGLPLYEVSALLVGAGYRW